VNGKEEVGVEEGADVMKIDGANWDRTEGVNIGDQRELLLKMTRQISDQEANRYENYFLSASFQ
jgi:hypothetical protein